MTPVVIRTTNQRPELLALALDSLAASFLDRAAITLQVDGPATRATADLCDLHRVRMVEYPVNVGLDLHLVRSTRMAATEARAFFLLSDDVQVSSPWALVLEHHRRLHPTAGYVSGYRAPWTEPDGLAGRKCSILGLIDSSLWMQGCWAWQELSDAERATRALDGVFMDVCCRAGRPPVSTARSWIQHLGIGGASGNFNRPDAMFVGLL